MARTNKIKWRNQDRVLLSRTVQQFNAKLTRESKKNPTIIEFLPERLKVADIRQQIQTRKDYNRLIKSYQRFLQKDSTKLVTNNQGYTTTIWNKREIQYKINEINRQRAAERKRANVSTYTGTMGSIIANNLKDKKYEFNQINPKNALKQLASIDNMVRSTYIPEKLKLYKENYKQALLNNFQEEDAYNIINLVDKFSDRQFMDLYYKNPLLGIDYTYSKESYDILVETISSQFLSEAQELGLEI